MALLGQGPLEVRARMEAREAEAKVERPAGGPGGERQVAQGTANLTTKGAITALLPLRG